MRIVRRSLPDAFVLRSGSATLLILAAIFGTIGGVLGLALGIPLLLLVPAVFLLIAVILLGCRTTIRTTLTPGGPSVVEHRRLFGVLRSRQRVDLADARCLVFGSAVDTRGAQNGSSSQRVSRLQVVLAGGEEILLGVDRRKARAVSGYRTGT